MCGVCGVLFMFGVCVLSGACVCVYSHTSAFVSQKGYEKYVCVDESKEYMCWK